VSIEQIVVHKHQRELDNHDVFSVDLQHIIRTKLQNLTISKIDAYNMDGDVSYPVLAGSESRLTILFNYPLERNEAVEIRDEEGILLATYIEKRGEINQINVFGDWLSEHSQPNIMRLQNLFTLIDTQIFLQKQLDYSWKSTKRKEELTKEFTDHIIKQQGRYLRDDQAKINRIEQDIREYTLSLKQQYDQRIRLMGQIEAAQSRLNGVGEKLIKDLDNIINNPKVKELFIKDGKFIVHTEPLYAYHDVSGDRYYIGNMRIEMNPQNTEVKFFGDNGRKSYWSESDPHPHVSGEDGRACLGNVANTIAELCSQMELYALTLIAIDFLESVNTSDTAGKNVVNWDMVDEEGNIIKLGGQDSEEEDDDEDYVTCDSCEGRFHIDDISSVYNEVRGLGEEAYAHDERYVCDDCRGNHYHYNDMLGEYITDDIDDDDLYDDEDEEEGDFF
jgi:hypothetical protein